MTRDGPQGPSDSATWMSYDSVAEIYERVAVPSFSPIAMDLVAAVQPRPGEKVLDLGTGTGLVASLVSAAVAPSGLVVGLDPSMAMLGRVAPAKPLILVEGLAPGLPFRRGVFDAVVANLVVSHLPDLEKGVADAVRILVPHGRLGCTAWAPPVAAGPENDQPEADAIVASVRQRCGIDVPPPPVSAVPYQEYLKPKDRLPAVLEAAGVEDLTVRSRCYRQIIQVEDYLSGWGSQSRYRRQVIGHPRWSEFVEAGCSALRDRFGQTISCLDEAWIVTGRRR
jgi:ubiquinone/menaquinone biosynthesis C-methylase UbiE